VLNRTRLAQGSARTKHNRTEKGKDTVICGRCEDMTRSKTRLAVYTTTTRVEIITIWPNSEDKRPTKARMRGGGRVDDRHRRQAALPEPDRQEKQHGGAEGRKKENKPS